MSSTNVASTGGNLRGKRSRGTLMVYSMNALLCNASRIAPSSAFLLQQRFGHTSHSRFHPNENRFDIVLTASSANDLETKLESLTVKELRDILKSSTLNERGILSRLKLKKELVEYLKTNLDSPSLNGSFFNLQGERRIGAKTKSNQGIAISMPKVIGSFHESQSSLSAKEAAFEKTYLQYPPLRDEDCSGLGENDIRQRYHPIFAGEHTQLTGDMDIIFVGTASCTPGISRGVSCTALRLNWNRQTIHGIPGTDELPTKVFNGGTWLFDCGECTQVSLLDAVVCSDLQRMRIRCWHQSERISPW